MKKINFLKKTSLMILFFYSATFIFPNVQAYADSITYKMNLNLNTTIIKNKSDPAGYCLNENQLLSVIETKNNSTSTTNKDQSNEWKPFFAYVEEEKVGNGSNGNVPSKSDDDSKKTFTDYDALPFIVLVVVVSAGLAAAGIYFSYKSISNVANR